MPDTLPTMRLGEALTRRADLQKRIAQLTGRLQASADAVQVTRYAVAQVQGQALTSLLDTNANPIGWRGTATLAWTRGDWDAAVRADYVGAYRNTMVTPWQRVPAWVTFDLHAAYAPSVGLLGRSGVRLALDEAGGVT